MAFEAGFGLSTEQICLRQRMLVLGRGDLAIVEQDRRRRLRLRFDLHAVGSDGEGAHRAADGDLAAGPDVGAGCALASRRPAWGSVQSPPPDPPDPPGPPAPGARCSRRCRRAVADACVGDRSSRVSPGPSGAWCSHCSYEDHSDGDAHDQSPHSLPSFFSSCLERTYSAWLGPPRERCTSQVRVRGRSVSTTGCPVESTA